MLELILSQKKRNGARAAFGPLHPLTYVNSSKKAKEDATEATDLTWVNSKLDWHLGRMVMCLC